MEHDFTKPVEDLETVPAQFRGLYTKAEEGEGYTLNGSNEAVKGAVEAIVGLNKALKASRAEVKDAKGRAVDLSSLSEFGTTPDEIKSTVQGKLDELTEQVKGGKEARVNVEKIKADLALKHATDVKAKEAKIDALQGQLYKHLVESQAVSALADKAINPKLALPHVLPQVKVVDEDGEHKVFVVDSSGDRRYSGVTGSPMTINELVEEMRKDTEYASLFKSEAKKGSAPIPGSSRQRVSTTEAEKMSPTQKVIAGFNEAST
jgi:hypothetical protein